MGRVYLAEDLKHGRRVAVKMLSLAFAQSVGADRFLREVSIISRLVHPHIVPLYDSGTFEGQLYYVMPYIEGRTLRQRLQQESRLPIDKALAWAADLAGALAYAHSQGFIHRDIKPENVLIQAEHVVIADFGIGRAVDIAGSDLVTSQGIIIGTPAYMSPEQASGEARLDGRTDIYSLACVVYEMLGGDPPFTGSSPQSIIARKLAADYPRLAVVRPAVPAWVERSIARALAPVAADRFATAEDFRVALTTAARPGVRRIMVTALALATLSVGAWQGWQSLASRQSTTNRVVVGVFENRTGDNRHDRFGIMAADWVTDGLQRTGVLDVVPTATALAASNYLKQQNNADPVRTLASETGAKLVITGSLYRDGDSLVIRSQLTDATNGSVVGAVDPIRVTESNLSDALGQLRARLMGLLALRLDDRVASVEVEADRPPLFLAYQAFSEGMDAYIRNDYPPAVSAFERAHRMDSTFVLPLLYMAFCYNNAGRYAAADSVLQLLATHRSELTMLDRHWLDYSQAELRGDRLAALSALKLAVLAAPESKATYNYATAALELRLAFAAESTLRRLSPDRGPMRGWIPYWEILTDALHAQEKHAAELEAAREARLRFPFRVAAFTLEMRALAALGRGGELDQLFEEATHRTNAKQTELGGLALEVASELTAHGDSTGARRFLRRAAEFYRHESAASEEGQWGLLQIATQERAWVDAVGLARRLVSRDPARMDYQGALGVALAGTGDRIRARAQLNRLADDRMSYQPGSSQFQAARIAAALGDIDLSRRLIETAFARGYWFHHSHHRDPILKPLRQHPLLAPSDVRRR